MAFPPLVWLITGTSSGFGRDLVLAALNRGDKVIATARGRSIIKLEVLEKHGADIIELDVTSPLETLNEVAKHANGIHGHIDVLVNNAGYIEVGTLEESTPEQSFQQYNTNVFGGLNVARAFLPYMRLRKTGTVIWLGSLGGWRGSVNGGLYISTKHALRGIAETMNAELEPLGLRSMIFEPGYFRTDLLASDNRAHYAPRIADYNEMTAKMDDILVAYNGKQPGDPKRAVEVIVDVVKGEGVAKGRKPPVVLQLGSDCYNVVHAKLEETLNTMEEWKDVIVSTDFPEGV